MKKSNAIELMNAEMLLFDQSIRDGAFDTSWTLETSPIKIEERNLRPYLGFEQEMSTLPEPVRLVHTEMLRADSTSWLWGLFALGRDGFARLEQSVEKESAWLDTLRPLLGLTHAVGLVGESFYRSSPTRLQEAQSMVRRHIDGLEDPLFPQQAKVVLANLIERSCLNLSVAPYRNGTPWLETTESERTSTNRGLICIIAEQLKLGRINTQTALAAWESRNPEIFELRAAYKQRRARRKRQ